MWIRMFLSCSLLVLPTLGRTEGPDLQARIDAVQAQVRAWRRHFHQHPELSNREVETARYVAAQLRAMGVEVQTDVGGTGVVGVIRGAREKPVVLLRADMDGLPVVEQVDLPFKSTVRTTYDGKQVGVMHACGHDAHMAMLLGAARVLAELRETLPGTVKLVFQPAEEGAPPGESPAGAEAMIAAGLMREAPVPDVAFALHVFPQWEVGQLAYVSGGAMASSDDLEILVKGRQTHGARPWAGVDPIVAASQIVMGLQTIASRQMELTKAPVIVTIGKIEGGVRNNIIPDEVRMKGTLRALDNGMRDDLHARVKRTAARIAEASGAVAEVSIGAEHAYPVTVNDPPLMSRMLPALRDELGAAQVIETAPMTGAEDFSFYAREVPGLMLFLGVRTPGSDPTDWAANHSPLFRVDEDALPVGVGVLMKLTLAAMSAAD